MNFVQKHENTIGNLVSRIIKNSRRYVDLFCEVIDQVMPPPTKDISDQDEVIDVILHQRRERNFQLEGTQQTEFPPHLLRR
jgi:DNA replication licensing factor MCM7